jgi:hypothetical protein
MPALEGRAAGDLARGARSTPALEGAPRAVLNARARGVLSSFFLSLRQRLPAC